MRSPSWSTIVSAAACAAALGPLHAKAADVRALIGIPHLSFAAGSSQLTRNLVVAVDDSLFAVDVSAPFCAQSVGSAPADGGAANCAANRQPSVAWLGEHAASLTLKIPQWRADAPYIDVSLRTWRGETPRDAPRSAMHGLDAEAEITQAIGPHELVAGYSHPIGSAADSSRVAWTGATMRVAPGTRLRFLYESAHDERSGARDSRYTVRLTRSVSDALRMTAYLAHAPEDIERRWRAGVGVDWTF